MAQTFEYPNLLTGSRSGAGWTHQNGYIDERHHHYLSNNTNKENFIMSPLIPLKHGITYALSVYTANTENCAGSDIFVLYEKVVTGWIAEGVGKCEKGPRGVDHFGVRTPRCLPGRELLYQIRQQWLNRWKGCDHLVRQPDAVHCFRTARMGSGRRGGVA